MNNTFGSETTNPRLRRAYAHSLRDKALATGNPQDKVAAVEAAATASKTSKGKDLGKQTLAAFRRAAGEELFATPTKLPEAHMLIQFTDEVGAKARAAVAELEGEELGVTVKVQKPNDKVGYVQSARRIDARRVYNSAGMIEPSFAGSYRVVPADTPSSETAIQLVADYHLAKGSHVVDVIATKDTENFYANVEAIAQPHDVQDR